MSPEIVFNNEDFGMDGITISLEWQSMLTQAVNNSFEYLVSYDVNVMPSVDATVIMIDLTRANLTVSYNAPYNVSIVAVFCDQMNTSRSTIIELIYGEYTLCKEI